LASATFFTIIGFFNTPSYITGVVLILIWLAYVFNVWYGERSKKQTMTEIVEESSNNKHEEEDKTQEAAMINFLSNLET